MILELDLGNSRAKWRIITAAGDVMGRGVGNVDAWLDEGFPDSWGRELDRIRAASVLERDREAALAERLRALFSVAPEFARSARECAGVSNAYAEFGRLGVDRWVAVIAAYRGCDGAAMVVDIGTALTVDVVDDGGVHLGGYIIPGAALMQEALLRGTDGVRFDSATAMQELDLGSNTASCVHHGIAAALTGAVIVALAQATSKLGKAPPVIVAGGAGSALVARLREAGGLGDCRLQPDLVLDGLRWVLP